MADTAPPQQRDLAQTTLLVLLIGVMIAGTFWVMRAFLPMIIWATTIVVATWPVLLRFERWFGNRRGWAVAVMTVLLLTLFIMPIAAALIAIVDHLPQLQELVARVRDVGLAPAPAWFLKIPLVGSRLADGWNELARLSQEELAARFQPYLRDAINWLRASLQGLSLFLVQLLLVAVISAILWANGGVAADGVRRFFHRLAGPRGERMVILAGQAIRSVALGIVITAVLQSLAGGIGLAVTGVPLAGVLTATMLILGIAQLGAAPVLIPAVIWQFVNGRTTPGIVLLIWSVVVTLMDNFIRPVLIRRGVDLPLLLILAGVIGGLLSFGVIGLFVGPVLLAVTYTLVSEWVAMDPARPAPPQPAAAPPAVQAPPAATA
ncbi:MAG: AI-2E family transporter YdiK [Gemmatimonadota bacterium]|nr:AI-2E family transporter YdiK [Gemmatimonadota bacterium]MDH4349174.1 AI-2E family transporter YdiK [Gemmatimonadota bacterium]MDH5283724.1 AI-2E family transporter YdiK [Gemmatimonadota bacterium]